MAKIVVTTKLTGGLISFRTELDKVDTTASLGTLYQRYKKMFEDQPEKVTSSE
jgi:hypothetical protein